MSRPMMACGHAANARIGGKPCCAICAGIHPGAGAPAVKAPDLSNRVAKCDCGRIARSSTDLAFFEHRGEFEFDRYYCGCRGWD